MNDQMQAALIKIIEKANSGIDSATALLSSEVPDVIHQLLLWNLAMASFFLFVALVFLSVASYALYRTAKDFFAAEKSREANWAHDGSRYSPMTIEAMLAFMVSVTVCPIALIEIIDRSLTIIQIWLAPKVWLIEYAAQLAK